MPESNQTNALVAALGWLQGTLLGSVATIVAVIAVASVGFLMLTGRIDVRRGAQVVLGCFILFGASSIAAGLHAAGSGTAGDPTRDSDFNESPVAPPVYPEAAPSAHDPYAGAALAPRQ